jgi:hypothetical protein
VAQVAAASDAEREAQSLRMMTAAVLGMVLIVVVATVAVGAILLASRATRQLTSRRVRSARSSLETARPDDWAGKPLVDSDLNVDETSRPS